MEIKKLLRIKELAGELVATMNDGYELSSNSSFCGHGDNECFSCGEYSFDIEQSRWVHKDSCTIVRLAQALEQNGP